MHVRACRQSPHPFCHLPFAIKKLSLYHAPRSPPHPRRPRGYPSPSSPAIPALYLRALPSPTSPPQLPSSFIVRTNRLAFALALARVPASVSPRHLPQTCLPPPTPLSPPPSAPVPSLSHSSGAMPSARSLAMLAGVWVLVATNPGSRTSHSFRRFASEQRRAHDDTGPTCPDSQLCVQSRHAFPYLSSYLYTLFAPHRTNPPRGAFTSIDYILFTIIRPAARLSSTNFYIGVLGCWLPLPLPPRIPSPLARRRILRIISHRLSLRYPEALPPRPWELLIGLFVGVGALWLLFPSRARAHLPLTWHNVRERGRWWCLVLFHFSHGGSWLRLARTVAVVSFLAPTLVAHGYVPLSALYGMVLTSSATSTALALLVLARRYALAPRELWPRAALEINGGGACVYALLVAACLSPASCQPFPELAGARPFELLMLNVLFDSFFLAGQKRVADYTAHTGAALGSWLFYSVNIAR